MGTTESIFLDATNSSTETGTTSTNSTSATLPTVGEGIKRTQTNKNWIGPINDENAVSLRGSILGSVGTGKTALYKRLRGDDPFQQPITQNGNVESKHTKNNSGTISWTGEDGKSTALVTLCDGRIADQMDFAIILIDPLREETLEDARKIANKLLGGLTNAGSVSNTSKQNKHDDDKYKNDNKNHSSCLCLCFLLNFKDISIQMPQQSIHFQKVQNLAVQLSSKTNTKPNMSQKCYVYCLESSMKNCYGLFPLHKFLQIPYHNRKETILKDQLQQLTMDRIKANTHLQMTCKHQDYSKFAKILSNSTPHHSIPSTHDGASPTTSATHNVTHESPTMNGSVSTNSTNLRVPTQISKSKQHQTKSNHPSVKQSMSNTGSRMNPDPPHTLQQSQSNQGGSRMSSTASSNSPETIPKQSPNPVPISRFSFKNPVPNTVPQKYDPNQSLDDFFADDDDDDNDDSDPDNKYNKKVSQSNFHITSSTNNFHNDSDSEDEDDFYYDLEGRKLSTRKNTYVNEINGNTSTVSESKTMSNTTGATNTVTSKKKTSFLTIVNKSKIEENKNIDSTKTVTTDVPIEKDGDDGRHSTQTETKKDTSTISKKDSDHFTNSNDDINQEGWCDSDDIGLILEETEANGEDDIKNNSDTNGIDGKVNSNSGNNVIEPPKSNDSSIQKGANAVIKDEPAAEADDGWSDDGWSDDDNDVDIVLETKENSMEGNNNDDDIDENSNHRSSEHEEDKITGNKQQTDKIQDDSPKLSAAALAAIAAAKQELMEEVGEVGSSIRSSQKDSRSKTEDKKKKKKKKKTKDNEDSYVKESKGEKKGKKVKGEKKEKMKKVKGDKEGK